MRQNPGLAATTPSGRSKRERHIPQSPPGALGRAGPASICHPQWRIAQFLGVKAHRNRAMRFSINPILFQQVTGKRALVKSAKCQVEAKCQWSRDGDNSEKLAAETLFFFPESGKILKHPEGFILDDRLG